VTRYALIRHKGTSVETLKRYLPDNYKVIYTGSDPELPASTGGLHREGKLTVIAGEDYAGWTLDDYVIPRLGSGLIGCREIAADDPLVREHVWVADSGEED
jgi:hypothetical protein